MKPTLSEIVRSYAIAHIKRKKFEFQRNALKSRIPTVSEKQSAHQRPLDQSQSWKTKNEKPNAFSFTIHILVVIHA